MELVKESLGAAALIQKTQVKLQNFQKRNLQRFNYWGHQGGSQIPGRGSSRGRGYHAGGSRNMPSKSNRS